MNYSLLIGAGGRVRLAPLYDIASALPYDDMQFQELKLAMKIGPDYRLRDVRPREWRKLAQTVRVDADSLLVRIRDMAARVPDEASSLRDRLRAEELEHDVIDRLADRLAERADSCRAALEPGI